VSESIRLQDSPILARYKRLRGSPSLTSILLKSLSKQSIMDSTKRLGLRKKMLISQGYLREMEVLLDYCVYSYSKGGRNAVERYLEGVAPAKESDHGMLLEAMLFSYYSIFQIKDFERGAGVTLFDLLRLQNLLLLDIGLSSTAVRGMMFAGRVLPLADYFMTSGAFIPLDRQFVEETLMPTVAKFDPKINPGPEFVFSRTDEARFSAEIIRAALKKGMLETMVYSGIEV
jgi:hypothetical protein